MDIPGLTSPGKIHQKKTAFKERTKTCLFAPEEQEHSFLPLFVVFAISAKRCHVPNTE